MMRVVRFYDHNLHDVFDSGHYFVMFDRSEKGIDWEGIRDDLIDSGIDDWCYDDLIEEAIKRGLCEAVDLNMDDVMI